ncbi:hypothetical protein Q0P45_13785, partial [Staphylococcus aureus]|nr:hypothetical protein [Staphylococcus aureus]
MDAGTGLATWIKPGIPGKISPGLEVLSMERASTGWMCKGCRLAGISFCIDPLLKPQCRPGSGLHGRVIVHVDVEDDVGHEGF